MRNHTNPLFALDRRSKPASRCRGPMAAALAGLAAVSLAGTAAAEEPDVIYLTGKVIDFLKAHPDFSITDTSGHVANNVALEASNNRPNFTGHVGTAGFGVNAQWRDKGGQNIAPHLFHNGGAVLLGNPPDYNDQNVNIDSWDSKQGTYGEGNSGGEPPEFFYPAPMPDVIPPSNLNPWPGPNPPANNNVNQSVTMGANTTLTFTESFQCKDLDIGRDSIIYVAESTHLVVYVTGDFNLGRDSKIIVPTSSTLHIYHGGDMDIGQRSELNMNEPLNPDRCRIYNTGTGTMVFNQSGKVCAHIVSPNGKVHFKQNDSFFGTIVAKDLKMDQGSSLHWDGVPKEICDELLEDLLGSMTGASAGAISSPETFDQWFKDVLGVNQSIAHTIALERDGSGIYVYDDSAFFPIDGQLFGNEGEDHNYNFTFQFKANFVHEACAAEPRFFEFMGADDVWVYIDGQLAMDLGGIMPLTPQVIEIDRLGLEDGETYALHFYFAQRNPYQSVFRIRTNIPLEGDELFSVSAMFD